MPGQSVSEGSPTPARARWAVGDFSASPEDGGWAGFVTDVDGAPVRFEAHAADLSMRPESVLTYFGPPALVAGVDMVSPAPVDSGWQRGFTTAVERLAPWVDGDGSLPAVLAPSDAVGPSGLPAAKGRGGLCFTAGVDSFWTLLRGGYDPTDLVYVWGYDVSLDDARRFEDISTSLRAVAATGGQRLVLVRTDARAHPHNRHLLWGFHHGAALAAVGILLSEELDWLVIPPSYPDGDLIPWGSRPDLDPLWSIPGAIDIIHASTPQARYARIIDIADEPLVHRHLRACWEYLGPGANCGRCEKCVRTMVMFAGAGTLDRLETFPTAGDLPAAVLALSPLPSHSVSFWQALVDDRVPPPLRAAVERLVEESATHDSTSSRRPS
jgi:hypothetical protein